MAVELPEKQLRDFTLSVRLRTDMREKLGFVSDALGVSSATVASMAIGQYVAQQYASLNASSNAIQAMVGSVAPQMEEMFKTLIESEIPCSSSSASSVQQPSSAVVPTKKQAKLFPPVPSSKSKRSTGAASSK